MLRDPFYNDIIDRLNKTLNPELFERCASDLLRATYPTLVPIRGGNDYGMDGAVADSIGEPFPLVITTANDVIGNLRGSLRSYVSADGKRRLVLLATSQDLTPRRKRNLQQAAKQLGFTLTQIHDQPDMANRLYRDPAWCKELLGLSGTPPALSSVPLSNRRHLGDELIGRDDDLQWLAATAGDLILWGQPGSGKTFLLQEFAKRHEGLFVVSNVPGEIAGALRAQVPKSLIVDDAHVHRPLLEQLRHLRSELHADFRIVASCWPAERDAVAQSLMVDAPSMRELPLLTRDQIIAVINAAGIFGPNALLHELLSQAAGRPGLAVTLCAFCLSHDIREVALGTALARDIKTTFGPLVGEECTTMLAAFAIGGNDGMPMEVVADELKMTLPQIHNVVTKLEAGGVLTETARATLAVFPVPLRFALVRDVFFRGASSIPMDGLFNRAVSIEEVTTTLIGARARGASIADQRLRPMVEQARSDEVWEAYAWLGPDECEWILHNHPEKVVAVSAPCLDRASGTAIPLLLSRAEGDERRLASNPNHPLRVIDDWVCSAVPGTESVVARRQALLDATLEWRARGGDLGIAIRAMRSVLSPRFEQHEPVPGSEPKLTIQWGMVTEEELDGLLELWPRIARWLGGEEIEDWAPIFDSIEALKHSVPTGPHISEAFVDRARTHARRMLEDVVPLLQDNQAALHRAKRLNEHLSANVSIALDPEFEVLFPTREGEDWQADEVRQKEDADLLVEKWKAEQAETVAKRLTSIEQEAAGAFGGLDGVAMSAGNWPRESTVLWRGPMPSSPRTRYRYLSLSSHSSNRRHAQTDQVGKRRSLGCWRILQVVGRPYPSHCECRRFRIQSPRL
ncbi:MAG: ATP-binding protein [Planctomycetes bacterium]|nr:ATP-binding protein [Planctomycetota bacterium]